MSKVKEELYALADAINEARAFYGLSGNYYVQYAYGRPRLDRSDLPGQMGAGYIISPRLPPGQLKDWMYAYLAGMAASHQEITGA